MNGAESAVRHGWRRAGVVLATILVVGLLPAADALALGVSNPPALAGKGFSVKLKGATGKLSLYLSPQRKLAKGAIALGHAKAKHGIVHVRIGSNVKPGGYFLLACTGKGASSKCASSKRATAVLPKTPARAPAGVNGAATPASGSASTGSIGSSGGSLTATGPDGTKYTLAFNSSSVQSGTPITMTPLTGLSGVGKFIAGVTISVPSGVGPAFVRGGILVITPKHSVALATRSAVAFAGTGQGIHTIPLAPQKSPITLPVAAPGGYALVSGGAHPSLRPRDNSGGAPPGLSGFYGGLIGGMAQTLADSGHDIGDGSAQDQAYQSAVKSVLDEWYQDIINSEVPPGLQDDDSATTAIQDLAAWAQTGATALGDGHTSVGGAQGYSDKYNGMSSIYGPNWQQDKVLSVDQKLAGAAYNRAQQKCADNDDLTQLPKILSWYKTDVLSGHADSLSTDALLVCAHFTVAFDSTMVDTFSGQNNDGSGSFTNEYAATVKIQPSTTTAGNPTTGSATAVYKQASGTVTLNHSCGNGTSAANTQTDQSGSPGTFTVNNFVYPTSPGGATMLTLTTGVPSENYLNTDHCNGFAISTPIKNWWSDWDTEHKGAAVQNTFDEYQFTLTPGGGADFGSIDFTDVPFQRGNAQGNENTTIKVTHTPAPFTKL